MKNELFISIAKGKSHSMKLIKILFLSGILFNSVVLAQTLNRTFSGTVVTQQFELVPNVSIEIQTSDGNIKTVTDAEGNFSIKVPSERTKPALDAPKGAASHAKKVVKKTAPKRK